MTWRLPIVAGLFTPQPTDRILKLRPSGIVDLLFEYHPRVKRLYLVRIDPQTGLQQPGTRADIVMADVETEAHAWKYAAAFVRGMQHITDPELRAHQSKLVA